MALALAPGLLTFAACSHEGVLTLDAADHDGTVCTRRSDSPEACAGACSPQYGEHAGLDLSQRIRCCHRHQRMSGEPPSTRRP